MSGFRISQQMGLAIVFTLAMGAAGIVSAQPGQPSTEGGQSSQQTGTPAGPPGSGTSASGSTAGGQQGLDPNRRVCRSQETLGSRLRKRTVCRTAAEWDQIDSQARQDGKDMTDRSNINYTEPKMGGG